jgi:raffinose/stachyose/melibiose transport system permease protein
VYSTRRSLRSSARRSKAWQTLSRSATRARGTGGPRGVPWIAAVPGVVVLLALNLVPAVMGGWYAFTDWNGIDGSPSFIGLENFRQIFADPTTRGALIHTLQLAGVFLILANGLGLLLALGVARLVKTRHMLRTLFFAPVALSPLAVGYVWSYILDYNGPLNQFLGTVGLDEWQRPWLGDPTWALWAILAVLVWQFTGLTMVIFLAGLEGIPDELDEAATVDGASTWLRFRRLTLPLLRPAIAINFTLTLIIGLRIFDQVLALTNGGPVNATETIATQVWKQTFQFGRYGYGAALALILAAMIVVLVMVQALALRDREANA